MKNGIFWSLMFTLISGVATWNVYENHQLKSLQPAVNSSGEIQEILNVRGYELSYTGRKLVWPKSLEVMGDGKLTDPIGNWGLVLAIDEVSCDVCRDEQTQFILELARELDQELVRIVVNSKKPMYARSYMRLNQINMPIYYDRDGDFFRENQMGRAPLMILHDDSGKVIASHFPLPGKSYISEPFHDFVRSFFGMN